MTQLDLSCAFAGQQSGQTTDVWAPQELGVTCSPESIEVGITCGMSDMCGESPCLCGAQDAWQDCACNGFETLHPDVSVQSNDPLVAQAVQMGGTWHVFGVLPGQTDVTVKSSLKHYDDAEQVLHVSNGAPGLVPMFGLGVVLAIVVAVLVLVRKIRRRSGSDGDPGDTPGSETPDGDSLGDGSGGNPVGAQPTGETAQTSRGDTLRERLQNHRVASMLALSLVLVGVFVLSLHLGRYDMDFAALAGEFARVVSQGKDPLHDSTVLSVFLTMRLPRIVVALLIGAALAGAGGAFQGIFKNPMVSPDLLGASAGAGFGAALAILLGLGAAGLEVSAFAFGILAVFCAYTLSRVIGRAMPGILTLILSGMVIANLFQAFISAAKYMADPNSTLPEITFWLMGGLSRATAWDLPWLIAAFAVGCIGLMALRWRMNVMAMGDEEAMALGVDVERTRKLVIAFATLLTSASTAVAGMVGWVGLIIPHLARAVVGSDHRYMIPASMLLGASFLLLVDDLCRSIYTTEIPLSILTSIIGVPLFIYLISKMKGVSRA